MTVIAVVLAIGLLQCTRCVDVLQSDHLFSAWGDFVAKLPLQAFLRYLIWIGFPCFLAFLLLRCADSLVGSLLVIPIELIIFIYALGKKDERLSIYPYIEHWQKGNIAEIRALFAQFSARFFLAPLKSSSLESASLGQLRMKGNQLFLTMMLKRWLVVLMWFLFVDPVAALLYRLIENVLSQSEQQPSWLVSAGFWMEWPVSRLAVLCFMVSGKVSEVWLYWCDDILQFSVSPTDFLLGGAYAALPIQMVDSNLEGSESEEAVKDAYGLQRLLKRTLCLLLLVGLLVV